MSADIRNTDDTIDSRDVIARIEELEASLECEHDARETTLSFDYAIQDGANFPESADELRILKALADEASGYAADWPHGETLIRDSYFKDYAMELADDIGAIDNNASWPLTCIDWDQAARELQMGYSAVDFDGVTYWIR